MKTYKEIKTWIERRIERRNQELISIASSAYHTDNVISNKLAVNMLKNHFETIYRAQYEMTQYMILLERIESYESDNLPEAVLTCQVIGELDCLKTSLKHELLNKESMPSTTNLHFNLCGLWETEVHKKMIRDISSLIK